MAYFNQEKKKAIAPKIKEVCKKYGMKATLAVEHHSTVVLNIKSGVIDFGKEDCQVNHYHIDRDYDGIAKDFLLEVNEVLNTGNWDRSDSMTDYFDVGHYVNINIGKWNKPYELIK